MSEKVAVQIKKEIYDGLEEKFERDKMTFASINVTSVEDFINYILNNFVVSSNQFDMLGESQKDILEKINVNDFDIKELFKQVTESLAGNSDKDEENKEEKTLSNGDYSKKN